MKLSIMSFGFKHGQPPDANFVFDVRRLRNPYAVPSLREKDGRHKDVSGHVLANPIGEATIGAIVRLLKELLPGTDRDVTIAIGCTGGHHRSVAVAEALAVKLKRYGALVPQHRDLGRPFPEGVRADRDNLFR